MFRERMQPFVFEDRPGAGAKMHCVEINRDLYNHMNSWNEYGISFPSGLEKACAKRQIDHLAGRFCAARALSQLGLGWHGSIGSSEDRSPVWPEGITGSVTHSQNLAVAVVDKKSRSESLGIDLEHTMNIKTATSVGDSVSLPEERELIPKGMKEEVFMTLIFSAKESIFKAVYPLTGIWFGFYDARITYVSMEEGTFSFQLLRNLSPLFYSGYEGTGNLFLFNGYLFTSVFIASKNREHSKRKKLPLVKEVYKPPF